MYLNCSDVLSDNDADDESVVGVNCAAAVDHLARYPIRHYLMICMHQISVYLFSRSPQKTFKNPLV